MQRITIGRYKPVDIEAKLTGIDVSTLFDGWVEGVRDDGTSWIMWLDALGNPTIFYGQRDEGGGVEGDPVILSPGHPYLDADVD